MFYTPWLVLNAVFSRIRINFGEFLQSIQLSGMRQYYGWA